jgi:hypothetical protein
MSRIIEIINEGSESNLEVESGKNHSGLTTLV